MLPGGSRRFLDDKAEEEHKCGSDSSFSISDSGEDSGDEMSDFIVPGPSSVLPSSLREFIRNQAMGFRVGAHEAPYSSGGPDPLQGQRRVPEKRCFQLVDSDDSCTQADSRSSCLPSSSGRKKKRIVIHESDSEDGSSVICCKDEEKRCTSLNKPKGMGVKNEIGSLPPKKLFLKRMAASRRVGGSCCRPDD